MTKTSALMGSPLYMSPEQMQSSRDVDARSDIWALGTILYELLTATSPFNADTLPQVCTKVMAADYAPITSLASDLPAELAAVVHRCMMVDPDARFQNVAEMAVALLPFASAPARLSAERIAAALGTDLPAPHEQPKNDAALGPVAVGTDSNWGETRADVPLKRSRVGLLAGVGVALFGLAGCGRSRLPVGESGGDGSGLGHGQW